MFLGLFYSISRGLTGTGILDIMFAGVLGALLILDARQGQTPNPPAQTESLAKK